MGIISLENEVEEAVTMVNGENSTDSEVVLKIANYKEELEKLKGSAGGEVPAGDDTGSEGEEKLDNAPEGDENASESGEGVGKLEEEPVEEITDEDLESAQEAFAVMVAVETIAEKLRQAQQHGGADDVTVAMATEMSDVLLNRIGFRLPKMVAVESLGSYTNRQANTQMAIEGLTGVLSDIWEGMKKFFRAMVNWVKEYIFGIKQVSRAQEDALKEIKDVNKTVVTKLLKIPLTEETVERLEKTKFKAKAHLLSSTKEATPEDVAMSYNDIAKFSAAFLSTMQSLLKSKMSPTLAEISKSEPDFNRTKTLISESDFSAFKVTEVPAKIGSDMVMLESEVLPGFKVLSVICPKDRAKEPVIASRQTKIYLNAVARSQGTSQTNIVTDAKMFDALAVDAFEIMKARDGIVKFYERYVKANDDVLAKILDSDMSNWVNLEEKQKEEITQDIKNYLSLSVALFKQPTTAITNYMTAFATALQDYVAYSQNHVLKALERQIKTAESVTL